MASYDPSRSQLDKGTKTEFLRSELTGDITEVPGIGPEGAKTLKKVGVSTTFQLIGKYLSLKGRKVDKTIVGPVQHAEGFWEFLKETGVAPGHRAGVVQCIAEKTNMFFPGMYNEDLYKGESTVEELVRIENPNDVPVEVVPEVKEVKVKVKKVNERLPAGSPDLPARATSPDAAASRAHEGRRVELHRALRQRGGRPGPVRGLRREAWPKGLVPCQGPRRGAEESGRHELGPVGCDP